MSDLVPPPRPEDLTAEDQQALLTGNITKVEQCGDEWRDDHIDCVAVRVHVDGRQINTSLWWCGPVIIGALRYADESARAKADVMRELLINIRECMDGIAEENDIPTGCIECERCGAECSDSYANTPQGTILCPKCAPTG